MNKSPLGLALLCLSACGANSQFDDPAEVANAAADAVASFDEMGQGGGFARFIDRPDLRRGNLLQQAADLIVAPAWADACWTVRFSDCVAGQRVKRFADCALGGNKLSGSVTLSFSDSACSLLDAGSSVTREADFTLTGRLNATLSVTSPEGGQTATRTADGWSYSVAGMQRVMKGAAGRTLFDISTRTLEPIGVAGLTRQNRVMNGGKLEVKHNLAGYTTVLVPEHLTWDGSCNCPVSGKLTGTVTAENGESADASVEIGGCGRGTVTLGGQTEAVTFDRCTAL